MKLVSYRAGGRDRYGIVTRDGGVIDASVHIDGGFTLRDVLAHDRLSLLRALADRAEADHTLADVDFLLPITEPGKIFCAGRNYRAYHEVIDAGTTPKYPSIFARFASSLSPHREPILKPREGHQLDYEGELTAVIGKTGRYIRQDEALSHVAGYTCMNEGTVRDWMSRGTQNTPAKNFERSGGLGPWIVTADEIPDPSDLRIITRRNGDVVQDGTTALMIFDIPFLIAHISTFTTLEPGDLIATGSPGGSIISQESPLWLTEGDVIEVEISGIGKLTNPIRAE